MPRFDYERHFIDLDGVVISYWDEGAGQPLVLIHGLSSSADYWAWVYAEWMQTYRVIAVDLPGFGHSPLPPASSPVNFTLDFAAQKLMLLIERLGLEHPVLIGHSMGGAIILNFALTYPDQAAAQVLFDTAGGGPEVDWITRLISVPILGELLFQPRRALMRRVLRSQLPPDDLDQVIALTYQYMKQPGFKPWMLRLLRTGVNFSGQILPLNVDQLARIKTPTLIVWGDQDRLFPVRHGEKLRWLMPNAKLYICAHTGHNPYLERALETAQVVVRFLTENQR